MNKQINETKKNNARKFALTILLFSFSLISTLITGEILLRVSGYQKKETTWNWAISGEYHAIDSNLIYKQRKNVIDQKNQRFTNSLGLKVISPDIESKNNLVIILGDSFVWGNTSPITTYPAQLETMLNSKGLRYNVLNAGVSGYGTDQQLLLFKRDILPHVKPAILVWNINTNDIGDNLDRPLYTIRNNRLRKIPAVFHGLYLQGLLLKYTPDTLKENSLIFNLVVNKASKLRPINNAPDKQKWSLEKMRLQFEEMNRLAKKNGFLIIFAISPNQQIIENFDSKQDILKLTNKIKLQINSKNLIDQNEIMLFNSPLNEKILGVSSENHSYFLDESHVFSKGSWHPNEEGNFLMALSVAEKICNLFEETKSTKCRK